MPLDEKLTKNIKALPWHFVSGDASPEAVLYAPDLNDAQKEFVTQFRWAKAGNVTIDMVEHKGVLTARPKFTVIKEWPFRDPEDPFVATVQELGLEKAEALIKPLAELPWQPRLNEKDRPVFLLNDQKLSEPQKKLLQQAEALLLTSYNEDPHRPLIHMMEEPEDPKKLQGTGLKLATLRLKMWNATYEKFGKPRAGKEDEKLRR